MSKPDMKEIAERLAKLIKEPLKIDLDAPAKGKPMVFLDADNKKIHFMLPEITEEQKEFITMHENIHRAFLGLDPLTFDELFPEQK